MKMCDLVEERKKYLQACCLPAIPVNDELFGVQNKLINWISYMQFLGLSSPTIGEKTLDTRDCSDLKIIELKYQQFLIGMTFVSQNFTFLNKNIIVLLKKTGELEVACVSFSLNSSYACNPILSVVLLLTHLSRQ